MTEGSIFMLTFESRRVTNYYPPLQSQDQDHTGQKVATKCIRVSSTATTKAIIETLIEKFRPDMKMLEVRMNPWCICAG